MQNINTKQLLIGAIMLVIAGLCGFYGGRYYERNVFRKRMVQMGINRNSQRGQRESTDATRPRNQFDGPGGGMMGRP